MEEILEILEENSRYSDEQIAVMAGKTVGEVREAIRDYEEKSIIAGYTTLINWENTGKETVTALIEVKITPQRGEGFDKVAERIYKFDQVKACYLMSSGGFDLTVIVEGKTMKEVAMFVSEKLAVQDNVIGTATHFVLKKYKDHGTIFKEKKSPNREVIFI
ncbi:MAG: Lrp/AsnC family transcriptional regulator [Clostridium sp.]|uniref:Lrp/AsnC family transcriptional regulator n=1 Tax=Clostridium sp. TaxID=1506 RepID=UPI0025B92114|nr:Lrp/AsnC family transcriptional regulator [Clostridium sp.]MBS4956968.1 Lrp/AsnC family transcriptional regulator [Clostridium sp.]MDO4925272.1 Lrp/AsnC family transcriptional regulator [Turicibacter sp.]